MAHGKPSRRLLCVLCGDPITAEEANHCSHACLNCGEDYEKRVLAWLHGRDDPALDEFLAMPSTSWH